MRKYLYILIFFFFFIFSLGNICFFSSSQNAVGSEEIPPKTITKDQISLLNFTSGAGTYENPYIINDAIDMQKLSAQVAAGTNYQGTYFKVANGINSISLGNFTPIGNNSFPFYGNFDGNGTEFVLARNASGTSYQGLFGYFGIGTIENLSVKGSVAGYDYVGGVVGYMSSGAVTNVYNLANISGRNQIGGVIGRLDNGTVQKSYNAGDITASGNYAGGLIGYVNRGTISYTYNTGSIIGVEQVGGLIGYTYGSTSTNYSTVNYGYSVGTVAAGSATYVGGVIGYGAGSSSNGNVRNYLFYDLSVMVNYSQPGGKFKPTRAYGLRSDTTNVKGLQSEFMLETGLQSNNYSSDYWVFLTTDNSYAYYPQLKVFADSANSRISGDSLTHITVDVSGGLGTSSIPFLIKSAFDMQELSRRVAEGNTFEGFHFKVDDGISNLILGDFSPVGRNSTYPFKGTFNGNGANFELAIDGASDYRALFGYMDGATIRDLSVSGSVKGKAYVAGVVAYQRSGLVQNVYNTADITATGNHVGGIVGYLYAGTVEYVYNAGAIIAGAYAGGLVGYTYGSTSSYYNTIRYGYSSGTLAGGNYIGGAVGCNEGNSASGNSRQYLYYDLATIANYLQPGGKSKPTQAISSPADTGNVKGLYREDLLKDMEGYGFTTAIWQYDSGLAPKNCTIGNVSKYMI